MWREPRLLLLVIVCRRDEILCIHVEVGTQRVALLDQSGDRFIAKVAAKCYLQHYTQQETNECTHTSSKCFMKRFPSN